jgi:hypothetical protein
VDLLNARFLDQDKKRTAEEVAKAADAAERLRAADAQERLCQSYLKTITELGEQQKLSSLELDKAKGANERLQRELAEAERVAKTAGEEQAKARASLEAELEETKAALKQAQASLAAISALAAKWSS